MLLCRGGPRGVNGELTLVGLSPAIRLAADGIAAIMALRQCPPALAAPASAHTQARSLVWAGAGELARDRDIDTEHRAVI
jgi:hypothetical protein